MLSNALLQGCYWKGLHDLLGRLCLHHESLPNTSFLPAFVAGFVRTLKRANPGTAKMPVFCTSFVATMARVLSKFDATLRFNSNCPANVAVKVPFVMGFAPALAAAFIGTGNMIQYESRGE